MNKVILMLVEGPSDEDALCGPTAMAISNMLVKSDCFYTDVTTANLFSSQASFEVLSNVENTVQRFVESHIEKNQGYDWKDLAAVVHVSTLMAHWFRRVLLLRTTTHRGLSMVAIR